ncbi:MAG: NAD(P)-dependent oxidoreductase [Bacteroidales bacterium]|nr:NAD(P)-dependent oxidoreductase [Bacteroidales bacterium]
MKNVLITGASGFIGSFLVEEGLKRNYQVYAGIRKSSNKAFLSDPKINFWMMDLSDKQKLSEQLTEYKQKGIRFQYIIHNAGATKVLKHDDFYTINTKYTQNLVNALIESNSIPDKFIFISSQEAVGPGDEKNFQPVDENSIPHPISMYGKSKLQAEHFLTSQRVIPYLILRPTGVYGPRDQDYTKIIRAARNGFEIYIKSTRQHISLIFVKDLAHAVYTAVESNVTGKIFFVSDGQYYTSRDLVKVIKKLIQKKTIRIVFPGWIIHWIALINEPVSRLLNRKVLLNTDKFRGLNSMNWLCDSHTFHKEFKFTPSYDLLKGMTETIQWYENNKY